MYPATSMVSYTIRFPTSLVIHPDRSRWLSLRFPSQEICHLLNFVLIFRTIFMPRCDTHAASCSSTRETVSPSYRGIVNKNVDRSRSGERLKSLEIAADCACMCMCVLRKCEISTRTNGFFLLRSWTHSFTRPLSCKLIARVSKFYLFFRRIFWIKCKILGKVWMEIFYPRTREGYM